MRRTSHTALFPLNRRLGAHCKNTGMEKKKKKKKSCCFFFQWGWDVDGGGVCVCVCMQWFLISIPIHMCRVSIWSLISDHMSGKSARVTEYRHRQWALAPRAQQLRAPTPDGRSQGPRLWGHRMHTDFLLQLRRGVNRLSHVSRYITMKTRGGKSIHILYLRKSTNTCVKKCFGKRKSTDSAALLE